MSPEIVNVVEADSVPKVEGRVCAVAMQDGDAPPGSWTASRTKGGRWNPGGPAGSVALIGDGAQREGKAEGCAELRLGVGPTHTTLGVGPTHSTDDAAKGNEVRGGKGSA